MAKRTAGRKTKKPRVVRLDEFMQKMTKRLCRGKDKDEALLLNTRNKAWTPNAIRCGIDRLKAKLEIKDAFAYAYRHTAASSMIMNGVDVLTVRKPLPD